ncbi:hypothetical protein [Halobacillus litoralis]|uniref:hypothetical protein n=1 Tax=Halobacillus litoralis TaxID=45668 RepID=UPI001CD33FEE|nr:hypothetical protein [Halobacillus litoralis]MCA1021553.1 hypothetical protein [Halobacillus litoralis]
MIARIVFDGRNKISPEERKRLEDFLGEEVKVEQLRINEDGDEVTFYSFQYVTDPKMAEEEDKELAVLSENVEIRDSNNFLVNLDRFMSEFPHLEIKIKGAPKSVDTNYNDVLSMMNEVSRKIDEANQRFSKAVEFNSKCDVHVPNLGLMSINKLAYATDYCTEELQRLLHQGWRIISVCPQPDQRRPDYILGMSVTEVDRDVQVESFMGNGREKATV